MKSILRPLRVLLLATATLLTTFALLPPKVAEAADCGAPWSYFGCCFLAGGRVSMKQEQTCCDGAGNCHNNFRCVGSACPV